MTRKQLTRQIAKLIARLYKHDEMTSTRTALDAGRLVIGRHTYGLPILDEYAGSLATVEIGSFCSIGPRVRFITGGIHPTNWVSTFPFSINFLNEPDGEAGIPATNGPIRIGSDVWIASDVTVLSGVSIGHGAVVAAGAVVANDLLPYTINAGVPAKQVRERFRPLQVEQLLESRWWDKSDTDITKLIPMLSSPNIENFLQAIKTVR